MQENPTGGDSPAEDEDQDAGPTASAELLDQEPERVKAEGEDDESAEPAS